MHTYVPSITLFDHLLFYFHFVIDIFMLLCFNRYFIVVIFAPFIIFLLSCEALCNILKVLYYYYYCCCCCCYQ